MASEEEQVQRLIIEPLKVLFHRQLLINLKKNIPVGDTGEYNRAIDVESTGDELSVTAPGISYAHKVEFGETLDEGTGTYTSTYVRRINGNPVRITRTYTDGMKPRQYQDSWRVTASKETQGSGTIRMSIEETLEDFKSMAGRVLPKTIEVTEKRS